MIASWFSAVWNSVDHLSLISTRANWGIAVTLLLGGVLTAVTIVATNRKDSLLRVADFAREERIAQAQKGAADANERAATLEFRAAQANEQVERLQQENLKLSARVQELNIEAEKERIERLKIEERVAPRTIAPSRRAKLIAALSPGQGSVVRIIARNSTPESSQFAEQLRTVFVAAGWQAPAVFHQTIGGIRVDAGVAVSVHDSAEPLGILAQRAFTEAGIDLNAKVDSRIPPHEVSLVVGQKR